jgi:hypothetical protein
MPKIIYDSISYIKTPEGFFVLIGLLLSVIGIIVAIYFGLKPDDKKHGGGRGGNAKTFGFNSTAIGGKGGGGGPRGSGGDGGHAESIGDNSFTMGGEGGEVGQLDRGGKGGRGPLHALREDYPEKAKEIFDKFGITEEMAKTIGKGGDGGGPRITP